MVELPRNRRQLFKYLFLRWDAVMSVSLLVALFALPLVGIVLATSVIKANITLQMSQATTNDQYAIYVLRLLRVQSVSGALSVLGFYPLCLGLNGAFRYYKKTVWSQGANIKDDFWLGVKDGLTESIFPSILFALAYLFFVSIRWFVDVYVADTTLQVVVYLLVTAIIVFVFSVVLLDIAQNQIYRCGVMSRLKNAVIIALLRFPRNLLFTVVAFLPFCSILFFPEVASLSVVFVVYAIYYWGTISLLWTLHSHFLFDKYINAESYPQLVDKGLNKEKSSSKSTNTL